MGYITICVIPIKGKTYREIFLDNKGMLFNEITTEAKLIKQFLHDLNFKIVPDTEMEICFGEQEIKSLMPLLQNKAIELSSGIAEVPEDTRYSTNIFGRVVILELRNKYHQVISTLLKIHVLCQNSLVKNGKLYFTFTKEAT
ncbi:MAG: hypothetical protein IT236_07855 [Bacteroidia bacterium]|nr:hypothetical protein [Bacteroidia bacterium]